MATNNPFAVNFTPTESPVKQTEQNLNNLQAGYTGAIQGQTTVPQLMAQYDETYRVPQLQGQIQEGTAMYDTLGNEIRNMNQSVAQQSQESLLTQGQKDRIVQSQRQPLLEQQNLLGQNLARLGENLSTAQSNAARMVEAEQIQQQKELQPWLQAFSNEEILAAQRMTSWTTQNAMELDRLLHNSNQGFQLSENEKNRMHELSMQEKAFQNSLQSMREGAKIEQEMNPYSNLMALSEGTSIYDAATGQVIKTIPRTYKSDSGGGVGQIYVPNFGSEGSSMGSTSSSIRLHR